MRKAGRRDWRCGQTGATSWYTHMLANGASLQWCCFRRSANDYWTIGVWNQGVMETLVAYTGCSRWPIARPVSGGLTRWRSARSPSPPAHPSPTLAQRPPDVAGSRGNLQNPFTDTHLIHTHLQAFVICQHKSGEFNLILNRWRPYLNSGRDLLRRWQRVL